MVKMFFGKIFIVILLMLLSVGIVGQNCNLHTFNKKNKKDIKVGVVLSGGGAKGVAHVGALRVIEQAGIKIDYIGGTSMGAIVAALYSVGYTVDQLDSIARVLDMSKLVEGVIPRKNQTFFKKKYDNKTFFKLPMKEWQVVLPQGLSNGQDVIDEFNSMIRKYNGHQDFNKLPIPLVIIATDIVTGEQVEFRSGNLPLVMRASASFPSLFSPVEIDGRLLVDGGVVNNFPVEEVKNMGADIVIGVSVGKGLYKKKDLTSIDAIIGQISSFKMVEKTKKQMALTNVLIQPDTRDYSVVSFDKVSELIVLGKEEATKHLKELKEIAKIQNSKKTLRKPKDLKHSYMISEIEVYGSKNYTSGYFMDKFRMKETPSIITINQLRDGLKSVSGTGNFDFIGYEFDKNRDSTYVLRLQVTEDSINKFVKLGVHYDNLYGIGVLVNITMKNKLIKGSTTQLEIVVSDKPRFNFVFFKDNANWLGFTLESSLNQYNLVANPYSIEGYFDYNFSGVGINIDYYDWTNKLFTQKTLDEKFAITLGVELKYIEFKTSSLRDIGDNKLSSSKPLVFDDSYYFNPVVAINADTKDNIYFPTEGLKFDAEYRISLLTNHKHDEMEKIHDVSYFFSTSIDYTLPVTSKISWTNIADFSAKIGAVSGSGYSYIFGGYNRNMVNNTHSFLGYPLYSIIRNNGAGYVRYHTSLQYKIRDRLFLTAHANFMNIAGVNKEWYTFDRIDYSGYALSLGYDSKLGPAEVTAVYSPETGYTQVLFNFGYWF